MEGGRGSTVVQSNYFLQGPLGPILQPSFLCCFNLPCPIAKQTLALQLAASELQYICCYICTCEQQSSLWPLNHYGWWLWNKLLAKILNTGSSCGFKSRLKTFLLDDFNGFWLDTASWESMTVKAARKLVH